MLVRPVRFNSGHCSRREVALGKPCTALRQIFSVLYTLNLGPSRNQTYNIINRCIFVFNEGNSLRTSSVHRHVFRRHGYQYKFRSYHRTDGLQACHSK